MTIQEVAAELMREKQNKLPSRFPCRAIMVKNIEQYCELLSQLKKIGDIRVVKSQEIFSSADVMPAFSNLTKEDYRDEWLILTGVSEYLRLFAKNEATARRFASLWSAAAPASSLGRIIIPLWGCEAQWFDSAINLNADVRQEEYYYDCTSGGDEEQQMHLTVLSGMFEKYVSKFKNEHGMLCCGLAEWFEYWENPSKTNTDFILLTKRSNKITEVNGKITIHVIEDTLSFVRENMPGGEIFTKENCSDEMVTALFGYAMEGKTAEAAMLSILNVSSFEGVDIMSRWDVLPESEKRFAVLWLKINPDESYISHCFAKAGDAKNAVNVISHEIFNVRLEKPQWVDEFKKLSRVMTLVKDEEYFKSLDEIPEFEKRLDYLTNATREERIYLLKMIGKWMRKDTQQVRESKKLKDDFPDISAYLSQEPDALKNDVGEYMLRYKAHKLENSLPEDEETYFCAVDAEQFDYRYNILAEYEDEKTVILWVDALGVEWLPLLCYGIEKDCDCKIVKAALAQATLPTETCFNEQWKSMNMPYKKLDKLDKLAHKGVVDEPDYYACIEEQMSFVEGISAHVSSLLKEYACVVITGDHGTSRLAARFFHKRSGESAPAGAEVYSHGRYCKLPESAAPIIPNTKIVKSANGEKYAVYCNYDHFKQSGFAAGAEDENAIYGEVHGGAAPEEMIVPVVVAEGKHSAQLTAAWAESSVKIMMKKAKFTILFGRSVKNISIKMGGVLGEAEKIDEGKTWKVVFSGVKAGVYHVEATADGHIVNLPDVTLQSALGGGGGDLP